MAYNGKYVKSSSPGHVILLRTALVLLVLVIVTTYMMGGLYARYTTNAPGKDNARVAKFSVLLDKSGDPQSIRCEKNGTNSGSYILTVDNQSEVAVDTTIQILLERDLEGKIEMTLGQGENVLPKPEMVKKEEKFVYSYATGAMEPSSKREYTLTFTMKDWSWVTATSTDNDNNSGTETKELKFEVLLDAVQID